MMKSTKVDEVLALLGLDIAVQDHIVSGILKADGDVHFLAVVGARFCNIDAE